MGHIMAHSCFSPICEEYRKQKYDNRVKTGYSLLKLGCTVLFKKEHKHVGALRASLRVTVVAFNRLSSRGVIARVSPDLTSSLRGGALASEG